MPGTISGEVGSATVSQSSLYTLAKQAGLSDVNAKTAAAIAMAESGGRKSAHNTNASTGDDSYGLWQINYYGALKAGRTAEFGPGDGLFDPQKNAKAMASISHTGQNFNAWSTYKSGAYKPFLANAVTDTGGQDAPQPSGIIDSTAAFFNDAKLAIDKTTHWVTDSNNWIRVGYVIAGTVLLVAGVSYVISSSSAGQAGVTGAKQAVKLASKVVPAGKAATKAAKVVT